ncbi:star-related lipid transfer protein 5-like [Plakobranchus ocellatus]|uniref:Star-related lipid transfer protein 5-like n=1 Tax=Plakobranchus ocellatus TaxID=259542 RepID=A0AAV4CVA8_9GAST|nr:star-related lipid transfer protein 5-like [Plakobranchus ocellatus]
MDYKKTVEDAKARGLGYLSDEDWKLCKSTEQFTIEMKASKNLSCNMLRMRITADAPLRLCQETITLIPGSRRGEWDPDVREIKLLENVDDQTFLFYVHTNSIGKGVISPREFVDVGRVEESEDQVLVYGCSVDHPAIASDEKYVRGVNGCWMHRITRKDGSTQVESIIESDMKGWIPSAMLNSTLPAVFGQAINNWMEFLKKEQKS